MISWPDLCKAPLDIFTPKDVEALPRLCLKENRYGTTFTALSADNMIISRGIVSFQTGDVCERNPGARLFPDVYVDCPECRKQRFYLRQEWRAEGLDDVAVHNRLQAWREDGDLFWCNGCQGTGWRLEPAADTVRRLGAVTWADHAMALSGPDLAAELRKARHLTRFPEHALRSEAARRLEALS